MRIPLPLPQHRDRAPLAGLRTRVGDTLGNWRTWAPRACSIVLAVALLVQLLRLALLGVEAWRAPAVGYTAPATPAAAPPSWPQTDLFFRRADGGAPIAGTDQALGYTLFGVRSGGDSGSAILAGKDGRQVSWAVGSELAPGITLDAVGADHAVLRAADGRHRLDLAPTTALAPATALARAALPATRPAAAPPAVVAASLPSAAPLATAASAAPASTAASALAGSPSTATAASADGYTLAAGSHDMALRLAGLKPGDVVLSVNGKPLDPERLGNLKDELKGASAVTIRYLRGDETHTATLPVPR